MQQAKGRAEETMIINYRLDKLRTKIHDIHNQLESCGEPFDFLTRKNKLIGFSDEKGLLEIFDIVVKDVEARLGKDYSAGTLKHYRTSQKRIEEFVKNHEGRKVILLSNFDFNFLSSFGVYLKTTFNTMPNTALSYHKHLKKVLNTAISMNYLSRNPYELFNSLHFHNRSLARSYLTEPVANFARSASVTLREEWLITVQRQLPLNQQFVQ